MKHTIKTICEKNSQTLFPAINIYESIIKLRILENKLFGENHLIISNIIFCKLYEALLKAKYPNLEEKINGIKYKIYGIFYRI